MSGKLKIFSISHKKSRFIKNEIFEPLHVGKVFSTEDLGITGDDTGDNISYLNPYLCELTGHYWVWKNYTDTDYIGFCHYRRYFYFGNTGGEPLDVSNFISRDNLNSEFLKESGISEPDVVYRAIEGVDVVLPLRINTMQWGSRNIIDQVGTIPQINYRYYDKTPYFFMGLDIIKKRHPYMSELTDYTMFKQTYGYYYNIFIMRADIFHEYCEWLFPIMFELHDKIDYSHFSQAEMRTTGFFAERFFNIFLNYKIQNGGVKTIKEVPVAMIEHPEKITGVSSPASAGTGGGKAVDICIPLTEDDAVFAVPTLISFKNLSPDPYKYKIHFLAADTPPSDMERLSGILSEMKIDFDVLETDVDCEKKCGFDTSALTAMNAVPSDRAVYIKPGAVITADISGMPDMVGSEDYIAAVNDIDVFGETKSDACAGEGKRLEDYMREDLRVCDYSKYFNDNVMVMNFAKMRSDGLDGKINACVGREGAAFRNQQDILNYLCSGKTKIIGYEWNVQCACEFPERAPYDIFMDYKRRRANPKIMSFYSYKNGFEAVYGGASSDIFWKTVSGGGYDRLFLKNIISINRERINNVNGKLDRFFNIVEKIKRIPFAARTYSFFKNK